MTEPKDPKPTSTERIRSKCDQIAAMLLEKNRAYGNSALQPVAIFSRGTATDLIRARIDDKLSRIKNAPDAFGEDPILDLIGYLVLLTLAVEDEAPKQPERPTRPEPGHLAGVGMAEARWREGAT